MLLGASCWVPCAGLASHARRVVMLLGVSYWVPCDGLASHSGESSNTPRCFMLQKLGCALAEWAACMKFSQHFNFANLE